MAQHIAAQRKEYLDANRGKFFPITAAAEAKIEKMGYRYAQRGKTAQSFKRVDFLFASTGRRSRQ